MSQDECQRLNFQFSALTRTIFDFVPISLSETRCLVLSSKCKLSDIMVSRVNIVNCGSTDRNMPTSQHQTTLNFHSKNASSDNNESEMYFFYCLLSPQWIETGKKRVCTTKPAGTRLMKGNSLDAGNLVEYWLLTVIKRGCRVLANSFN